MKRACLTDPSSFVKDDVHMSVRGTCCHTHCTVCLPEVCSGRLQKHEVSIFTRDNASYSCHNKLPTRAAVQRLGHRNWPVYLGLVSEGKFCIIEELIRNGNCFFSLVAAWIFGKCSDFSKLMTFVCVCVVWKDWLAKMAGFDLLWKMWKNEEK